MSPASIDPQWRSWAIRAVLDGVSPEQIEAILVQQGGESVAVSNLVKELTASEWYTELAGMPKLRRLSSELRRAHHKLAGREVMTRAALSPAEFVNIHVAHGVPVKIPGFCSAWPAVNQWDDQGLRDRVGAEEVSVCVGRAGADKPDQNFEKHTSTMMMEDYIEAVGSATPNDVYMIAHNRALQGPLRVLWDDIIIPEGFVDPVLSKQNTTLWYGPAGTHTPAHHDPTNVFFCQVRGAKEVWLAPPESFRLGLQRQGYYATEQLEPLWRSEDPDVLVLHTSLQPGDALLIPAGWWHEVRSSSVSISLGFVGLPFHNAYQEETPGRG